MSLNYGEYKYMCLQTAYVWLEQPDDDDDDDDDNDNTDHLDEDWYRK